MEKEFIDINNTIVNPQPNLIGNKEVFIDVFSNDRFGGKQVEQIGNVDLSKQTSILNPFITSNISEINADNQTVFQAIRNGFSQLVTGTLGELVSTPGYIGGMFEPIEEMDSGFTGLFLDAGKAISEGGQEFAPIHQSQASREKVFAPWDSEWMAQTVADFGPTVALVAATLATEGLATPRLLGMLSKTPGLAKYAKTAIKLKEGSSFYKGLRATNSALLSRTAESGMEAYQTFEENYAKLKQENSELSDEEMKKLAGEAGAEVWRKNWALIGLDYIQYHGLLNGFGKFGKLPSLGVEIGTEALEEGVQYAFQQEAKEDLDFKLGKTDQNLNTVETFFQSLGDTEMQKAMVQGALGGAIFQGAGYVMDKITDKYRQPQLNSIASTIKEAHEKGDLPAVKKDIETKLNDPEINDEQKEYLKGVQQTIQQFESTVEAGNSPEVAQSYAKADQHQQEVEKQNKKINKASSSNVVGENTSKATYFVEATQAPTIIDNLKEQYSGNTKALKILNDLEKKYKKQEEENTYDGVTSDAVKVIPLVKKNIKTKVENEFLQELNLVIGEETSQGKTTTKDKIVEDAQIKLVKQETDVNKLLQLRDSESETLSKAAKSRLRQLYNAEDKNVPDSINQLVSFFESNPLTFKAELKKYDLPQKTTLGEFKDIVQTEEFKNKFDSQKQSREQNKLVEQKENEILGTPIEDPSVTEDFVEPQADEPDSKTTEKPEKVTEPKEEQVEVNPEPTPIASLDEQVEEDVKDVEEIESEPQNFVDITEHDVQDDLVDLKDSEDLGNPPDRIKTTDAYVYIYNEEKDTFNIPSMGKYNISAEEFDATYQAGKRDKGYHVLYDKDGQVLFFPRQQEPTLDIEFLRNLAQVGDVYNEPVTLEVDPNYVSGDGKWTNKEQLEKGNWRSLKVAIKIQGKTIGFLSDADKVTGDPFEQSQFEQLRKTLFNNTKSSTGIYTYPVTTKIKFVNPPRFWQGPRTTDLMPLKQEGKPIILGVVKNGKLFLNNAPLTDIQKEELEGKFNLSDGAVYWFLTNPVTGEYIPYRLFTTKVSEHPDIRAKIRKLFEGITEQNWKDKRKEIQSIVRWKEGENSYGPDFGYTKNGKFFIVNNGEKVYSVTPDTAYDSYIKENGYNKIKDSPVQIDSGSLNQPSYNEALINKGIFVATLNDSLFHSPNFKIDLEPLVKTQETKVVKRHIPINPTKFSLKKNKKVEKWDEKKETQWFKDKIGELIDLNVVDEGEMAELVSSLKHIHNMDNVEAWGFFHRASVYLLNNNRKNILAHEAYHAIETLVLSDKQITSLNKYNTEEDRAELFEEYVEKTEISEELLKKSSWYKKLGATIKRLFRKMYLAMKAAVGLNLSQDEVFFNIQSGTYKNNKGFKRNVEAFKPSLKAYSDNLKQQDRLNQVQREFNEMYIRFKDKKQKEGLTKQQILDLAVKPTLDGTLNTDNIYYQLNEVFMNTGEKWREAGYEQQALEYEELSRKLYDPEVIGDKISDSFGPMYFNALDNLKDYGIRVTRLQGDLDINDESRDSLENWMEAHPAPAYEAMSKQIKMGLAALPRGEFVEGEFVPERDDLTYPRFVDPFEVYSYLKDELSDSLSVEDYMDKLEVLGKDISWAKILHEILTGARPSTIISDTGLFKSQMYKFMQEPKPVFKYLLQTIKDKKKGLYEWRFNNSASKSIANRLETEWIGNISSPLYNKVIEKDELEKLRNEFEPNKDNNDWLFRSLNDLGITLSKEAINEITASKGKTGFLKGFGKVIDNVDKENFKESMTVRSSLESMAKAVKKYYPEFHLPAFTNVEGETVQNYIRNSFMARQMNKFKSAKHRKSTIDFYRNDLFYAPNQIIKEDSITGTQLRDDSYSLWLDRIEHNDAHNKMDFAVLDGQKLAGQSVGTPYADLSPLEFNRMTLNAFYNNGNYKHSSGIGKSFYSAQIMADSGSHAYIGFESYEQEVIINKLVQLAKNEYFAFLHNQVQENKIGIKGYNPKMMFVPGLIENKNNLSPIELQQKAIELVKDDAKLRLAIKTNLDLIVNETIKESEKIGLTKNGKSEHLDYRLQDVNEFIKDFVYNDFFAQTQIITLFHGKLYQYKSMEDFYKRAKEIWSPGDFIDTSRTGVNQKFLSYFVDSKSTELNYRNNKESVDAIYNNILGAGFSEDDAKKAAVGYGYTDGTFTKDNKPAVTLSNGTVIESDKVDATDAQGIIDIHRWREIMLGKGMESNEVERIYNAIINDTYTIDDLTMVMNPIKQFYYTLINVNGQVSGLQIKNSEYVLLPQIAKGNKQLEDILKFLDKSREKNNGLNASINFDSAVKVGLHKVNKSLAELSVDKGVLLDNNEYRIQGEVPEHQVDTTNLLGTQLRKLIVGDLDWNDVYEVNGEEVNGKQLIEEWNQLLIADIWYSSEKLQKEFSDPKKFYKMLQDEAVARDYPDKFVEALTLVDGKPRLGLFHPLLTKKSQALVGSIYRNNITKMKFNGMTAPNAAMGSEELKIVYNKDNSIRHFEAYLPLWSKSLVKNMDEVTVEELEKLGLDLGVAYRIPTEAKYSMIPLKIKGFTNAGIVLPAEITKVAGLDYDIDKMFVMLYEFITKNGKPVKVQFNPNPKYNDYEKMVLYSNDIKQYLNNNSLQPTDFIGTNLVDKLFDEMGGDFLKLKGQYESVQELLIEEGKLLTEQQWADLSLYQRNTQKARDNRKLDIIRGVLNSPKTIKSQLTPGGFDDLKEEANRIEDVKGDKLDKINPMTLLSRTKIFSRMMAGKKLIGIPANYNATHALMQHNNLELKQPVLFNGESGKDLGLIYTLGKNIKLISNNFAQYLASVVDNGKDPLADKYNLNTYTADVAMLLSKFFPIETGMQFIAQPSIVEFYKEYVNAGGNYKAEQVAIEKVLGMSKRQYNKAMEEFVLENIDDVELESGLTQPVKSDQQKKMLMHFLYYKNNQAKDLGTLVAAIKVPDAGTSSSIAKTISNMSKVKEALNLDSITGIKEFLNDENLANNSLYEKGILDAMRKFIELGFPDYINKDSAFVDIQDKLSKLKGRPLSEKEIGLVNDSLYAFMASKFQPLRDIDTKKLMVDAPKLWKQFIDLNNKEYYAFMGAVDSVPSEYDDKRNKLVLNNNIPKDIENKVMNQWEQLMASPKLINSTYTESDLGRMLTEYAYVTNGFRFAPGSLSHIQPISYYENLTDGTKDFNTFIEQEIKAANQSQTHLSYFYDQFIRHYFPRLSYVESIEKENGLRVDEKTKQPYAVITNDFSGEYIKYRDENRNWYLFKLETKAEDGTTYYERVNPLGLYREIEEWTFDLSPKDSIFASNNMNKSLESIQDKFVEVNDVEPVVDEIITIENNIINKSDIQLNTEQQEAVNKAIDFINTGNPNDYFVIEGKAGTGKTTIAEYVAKEFRGKNIQVAALSHKAKGVIREKFIEAGLDKGFGFQSIASLLGQTMDLETGKFEVKKEFDFYKEPPIANADIIIIDEASMVNEQALELIMEGKRNKAKVIFLGDIGQLPPIRTVANDYYKDKTDLFGKKSPVFESKNKAKLLERVRQGEESPILPYADYFWENSQVPNPVINPAKDRVTKITPKGSLVFTNTFGNIKDEVLDSFKIAVAQNKPNHIKVVTYRNSTRQGINKLVHDTIFGTDSPQFNKGELIMFNANYTIDTEKVLENSFETQIIEAGKVKEDSNGVKYQMIQIDAFDTKTEVPVVLKESVQLYKDTVSQLFKSAFALKGKPDYRQALSAAWAYKNKYANVDYAYAITSHKSQGSTYDIVVVDEKDIISVGPIGAKEKSESIYTALTRPRNVAVVISSTKVDESLEQSLEEINNLAKKSTDKPDTNFKDNFETTGC